MSGGVWLHPAAYAATGAIGVAPGSPMERLMRLAQALVPEDLQRLCDNAIGLWEYRAKVARRAGMTADELRADDLKERIEKWHTALADPAKRADRLAMMIWRRMLEQDEAELRQLGGLSRPRGDRSAA